MKAIHAGMFMLAGAAIGALATHLFEPVRSRSRRTSRGNSSWTDPSIPPSESSATRERDATGYAQNDADQELWQTPH